MKTFVLVMCMSNIFGAPTCKGAYEFTTQSACENVAQHIDDHMITGRVYYCEERKLTFLERLLP
jgi:hypothetical protein